MPDLRTMKDRAADHARKGRFAKAVELLDVVVVSDPKDLAARQKLAEALRRAGDARRAIQVYAQLADLFAVQGELIKAIAVCKVILDVDPKHLETQTALADLYTRRREEPSRPVGTTPGRGLATGVADTPPQREVTIELQLIAGMGYEAAERAEEEASPPPVWEERSETVFVPPEPEVVQARVEAFGEAPKDFGSADEPAPAAFPAAASSAAPVRPLPTVPLFSDLSREAFVALAGRLTLSAVPPGAVVLREGDRSRTLFVVVSGRLRVEQARPEGPLVLARLGEGDFFGEMALLTGEPRIASVVAEHATELLEIPGEALATLCRDDPSVPVALTRFFRRRLLSNALRTSPIFLPFSPEDRDALARRFETMEAATGAALVTEGTRSDGLYVVLSGRFDVLRGAGGTKVAELREGDLFGEMSCLTKKPATATVVARRRAVVLKLARADFDEIASTHPQVLELVAGLADDRSQSLEALAASAGPDRRGPHLV